MGTLGDWIKKNSRFIQIPENQTLTAVYEGHKIIPSRFDTSRETVQYLLKVNGSVKTFETGAAKVARFFDGIKPGLTVNITRRGSGLNTSYECSVKED